MLALIPYQKTSSHAKLVHAVNIVDRNKGRVCHSRILQGKWCGFNPSLILSLLNCSFLYSMHLSSQHFSGSLPLSLQYKTEGVPIPLWEAKPSLI